MDYKAEAHIEWAKVVAGIALIVSALVTFPALALRGAGWFPMWFEISTKGVVLTLIAVMVGALMYAGTLHLRERARRQ